MYVCGVFKMSDGRYEAEERQRLDDKYLHMCQVAEDSARELMERDKMLYASREKEKELSSNIRRLCGIIECYLIGSESLEKIDDSAKLLLGEVCEK
tara:strand:- start:169 stop:456 length:288 start_codon:yes stop_codon:yes gene_type:complete